MPSWYRILLFVVLFPLHALAQSDCSLSISDKVFDADSREPLPFANIYIKAVNRGTTTNDKGKFVLGSLCQGTYIIEFS